MEFRKIAIIKTVRLLNILHQKMIFNLVHFWYKLLTLYIFFTLCICIYKLICTSVLFHESLQFNKTKFHGTQTPAVPRDASQLPKIHPRHQPTSDWKAEVKLTCNQPFARLPTTRRRGDVEGSNAVVATVNSNLCQRRWITIIEWLQR